MARLTAGGVLLGAGVALVALFFLLAPALPLYGVLERHLGGATETAMDVVGLTSLLLLIAGYPLYKLEGKEGAERDVAVYEVAEFLTLVVLLAIAIAVREALGLEGVRGVLVGILAGSPWLAIAYVAYLRRLAERARRARARVVVVRIRTGGEE